MIEQERIDRIKAGVDLKALAESRGIRLKKNGKGYFGLCPFHHDKNPSLSITPSKNEWHCFGCGAGGDVIRFVELFDRVDFKEAVRRLDTSSLTAPKAVNKKADPVPELTAAHARLFNRVAEFYHTAFAEDVKARQYLENRCIDAVRLAGDYGIGFAGGSLMDVLPGDEDLIRQLKEIGILNQRGKEHFYGCVVVPLFDMDGNPQGMYGRRVTGRGADHLYLPGPRKGLFNRQAAISNDTLILTESVLDSLTLISFGIANTMPCYGVNGLTGDHLALFREHPPKEIVVCFDGDDAGRTGASKIVKTLTAEGFAARTVNLPEGRDINEFFILTADPVAAFTALVEGKDAGSPGAEPKITLTEYGFETDIDARHYQVRGIGRKENKLKATVKGVARDRTMHVDTVDFYSARSRAFLTKGLCGLFNCEEDLITRDVAMLLEAAEAYRPSDPEQTPYKAMTEEDKARALRFLQNPDMFKEILDDFETLGYTGEKMNKLLCYVAAVSRKMDHPLSVMIQSRSAAGKSYLQDTVLSLVPDEDCVKYTRLTDQALFYTGSKSLKHKILAIEELDGMNGAIYSIRSIQPSKELTIAYTGKDSMTGEQKTMVNKVEGPLMVFITTTQVDIDGETASRFVFVSIDESEDMTKKVLAKQRQSHTMQGMLNKLASEEIVKKHHNANRMLRPLHVFNPYAELLTFTSRSLRARRDHTKYLNLILAVAYLFQYQKEVHTLDFKDKSIEYVNVNLDDIEKANTIAAYVLGRTLDELAPPSRALLDHIRNMVERQSREPGPHHFTRRDIRTFSGWSDFQVKTHIRQLEELEYLYAVTGKKGKEYVYELLYNGEGSNGRPFVIGLTDPEQLKEKAVEAGIHPEG